MIESHCLMFGDKMTMSNTKLLVIGANGMLGGSLLRYFSCSPEYKVMGTVRSLKSVESLASMGFDNVYADVDVADLSTVKTVLEKFQPDYVLNCVGIIKQNLESRSSVSSIKVNSLFPHELADACSVYEVKLIHFSTDCVFSGAKGCYKESDVPDARDLYGRSKLLGEVDYGRHLTLRTSIIGHEIGPPVSLIGWFLNQENNVKGFPEAIFSGFPTVYIAEFLEKYVFPKADISGLYHFSADPISKYDLLSLVNDEYSLGFDIGKSFEVKVDRSLDSSLLRRELCYKPPSWLELIKKMHNEFEGYFS